MPKTKKARKAPSSKKSVKNGQKQLWLLILLGLILLSAGLIYKQLHDKPTTLETFKAQPFNVVHPLSKPLVSPSGMTPVNVRNIYNLSGTGSGTIAIIDAYDDPSLQSDLSVFTHQYGLTNCTTTNRCLEIHKMRSFIRTSTDWAVETSLDVEWAHAVSPSAKILLVEAATNNGSDLLNAIDYARARSDVVAVSMSWGGNEFSSEGIYESHFTSTHGATFFASSGDNGHGTSWPAVSANVLSVGGTTVHLDTQGDLSSETAWSGSGGGLSSYIAEPAYQSSFGVPSAGGKRAVPDIAYDADPASGFPVYDSVGCSSTNKRLHLCWYEVGGTSAGAPQWAAIRSISASVTASTLYSDAAQVNQHFLRDITSGTNGSCGFLCGTQTGYDYVTGLGTPLGTTY